MKINTLSQLIISLILAFSPGAFGSVFTVSQIPNWYAKLNKPSFNPPDWIFGPVWTILYTMMGVALFLVWQNGLANKKTAFAFWFFIVHLIVNFFWTFLFFGLTDLFLGFIAIITLWLMIITSIYFFWSIDKRASILLVPYLLWVSFAGLLNFSILQLN